MYHPRYPITDWREWQPTDDRRIQRLMNTLTSYVRHEFSFVAVHSPQKRVRVGIRLARTPSRNSFSSLSATFHERLKANVWPICYYTYYFFCFVHARSRRVINTLKFHTVCHCAAACGCNVHVHTFNDTSTARSNFIGVYSFPFVLCFGSVRLLHLSGNEHEFLGISRIRYSFQTNRNVLLKRAQRD